MYKTLLEKQVDLDDALSRYHRARLSDWSESNAKKAAEEIDSFLHDSQGQRHRVTIVSRLGGDQPMGLYRAVTVGEDVQLRHRDETTRVYSLLDVSRIEFVRDNRFASIDTNEELRPMTETEAKRMLGK